MLPSTCRNVAFVLATIVLPEVSCTPLTVTSYCLPGAIAVVDNKTVKLLPHNCELLTVTPLLMVKFALLAAVAAEIASSNVRSTPLGLPAVDAETSVGAVVSACVVVRDSAGPGLSGAGRLANCRQIAS